MNMQIRQMKTAAFFAFLTLAVCAPPVDDELNSVAAAPQVGPVNEFPDDEVFETDRPPIVVDTAPELVACSRSQRRRHHPRPRKRRDLTSRANPSSSFRPVSRFD